MSEIVEARVIQADGTESEWLITVFKQIEYLLNHCETVTLTLPTGVKFEYRRKT